MEASPFLHKITIKNSDGACVTSEILSNSLETESQKEFVRQQFVIINKVLGIENSDKILHKTNNKRDAELLNKLIQNTYELALQNK